MSAHRQAYWSRWAALSQVSLRDFFICRVWLDIAHRAFHRQPRCCRHVFGAGRCCLDEHQEPGRSNALLLRDQRLVRDDRAPHCHLRHDKSVCFCHGNACCNINCMEMRGEPRSTHINALCRETWRCCSSSVRMTRPGQNRKTSSERWAFDEHGCCCGVWF